MNNQTTLAAKAFLAAGEPVSHAGISAMETTGTLLAFHAGFGCRRGVVRRRDIRCNVQNVAQSKFKL